MRAQVWRTLAVLMIFGGPLPGTAWAALQQATPASHTPPAPELRVDVNQSTLEELLKVPGMTRPWAGRIMRFRPYRTKLDLLDRGIVTPEVYNRIKDYIIAHREKQ